jgi:hypothetical protein
MASASSRMISLKFALGFVALGWGMALKICFVLLKVLICSLFGANVLMSGVGIASRCHTELLLCLCRLKRSAREPSGACCCCRIFGGRVLGLWMFCRFLEGHRARDEVIAMPTKTQLGVFFFMQRNAPYVCVYEFVYRCEDVLVTLYIV